MGSIGQLQSQPHRQQLIEKNVENTSARWRKLGSMLSQFTTCHLIVFVSTVLQSSSRLRRSVNISRKTTHCRQHIVNICRKTTHQLPIWTPGNEVETSTAPTESAFRGKLRRYELSVGEDELDLMNEIMRNKEEIDVLIDERVQEGPCKFHLHVDVSMIKFSSDTNETGDVELRHEKTMLYLSSRMINVFFNGIEKETYLEMIEHMANAINTFASYGSGWIVESIEKLAVSFAAFSPIRACSYIGLPYSLKPVKQSFTNIKTRNDQKCFLYCFVAAYHDRYSETTTALYPAAQSYQHRNKLKNYKLSQELVVEIEGWYEMPMGLHDIDRSEQLNNCQVNVFR